MSAETDIKRILKGVRDGVLTLSMARKEMEGVLNEAFMEGTQAGYDNACWQSVDPELKYLFEDQKEAVLAGRRKVGRNV